MKKLELLKTHFGFDGFRAGQEEVIDSLLAGRDTLAVMPTGMGKSLCYQLPALLTDGLVLVVSPLISLMNDQVSKMQERRIPAACLNRFLSEEQKATILANALQGRYKLLYVTPERLMQEPFIAFARKIHIPLLAIDEAHCISQWGNDFRPDYHRMKDFFGRLDSRPIIGAFTATATPQVREDIVRSLDMRMPHIMVNGFDRPNLSFTVRRCGENRYSAVKGIIRRHPDESGIIYCITRKQVERIHEGLLRDGIRAGKYHAGMADDERLAGQDAFMAGQTRVMIATNAFGMGIDKPDIRYIVHHGMPGSLEQYYQETGRAGRDGKPSESILLFNRQDVEINQMLIDLNLEKTPEAERRMQTEVSYDKLRTVHQYCLTHDCLRASILRYFGEAASGTCANCSNCQSTTETTDVTTLAQSIIVCIEATGGRFGVSTIHSILIGQDVERLRKYRLSTNPCFGRHPDLDYLLLRETVDEMLVEGYLIRPSDAYAALRTTPASTIVAEGRKAVTVKRAV